VFCQIFQHAQHALGAAFADGFDVAAFLQQLAAHVQRQVVGIDHAFDKAQVARQQRLGIVHDEDAFDVQLQARVALAVVQIHGCFAGDVQQLGVFLLAFHAVVGVRQRIRMVVADLFVKVLVLLRRDVFFGARPQGAGLVHGFPFAGHHHAAARGSLGRVVLVDGLALFPFFLFHQNRQADVV